MPTTGGLCAPNSATRRAQAQLTAAFPHLRFENVRGNLNTRLRKLEQSTESGTEGQRYTALCLAAAGVIRMGWRDRIGQYLDAEICLHAVGQGSVAIECRSDDAATIAVVRSLEHTPTALRCVAERAFMRRLEGGCSVPLGVHTVLEGDTLTMVGGVFSLDGSEQAKSTVGSSLPTAPFSAWFFFPFLSLPFQYFRQASLFLGPLSLRLDQPNDKWAGVWPGVSGQQPIHPSVR